MNADAPHPPPVPDYNKIAEESAAKSEAEIRAAEAHVERMRSGEMQTTPRSDPDTGPIAFTVELDWRGESAYYIETDRRVWVFASYWGGDTGHLEHIHGMWEYSDGRRVPLTDEERASVLRRLMQYIKLREGFEMRAKELE